MDTEIQDLKKAKRAVVLAHNYQLPEIQENADVVGDSLELAIRAREATADILVVCGVDFMAETAKILNPDRKVLIPVREATCPLAHMLTAEMLREARAAFPEAAVVVYVNSTAEAKALADVTCTSANAVAVVRSLEARDVIFAPDANLAAYVQKQVPEKRIIPIPPGGHCYVHTQFTVEDVGEARAAGRTIVCHPECDPAVQALSDYVASTGGMTRLARMHEVWSVFTEREMTYRLRTLFPDRTFVAKEGAICYDMKKTTLEDLRRSLRDEVFEVTLPREVMDRARGAIERMVSVSR
ncbi:MAG: quinolinate synthase NadA [Methanomicrobiales archaeon]|nr:quinolinate synthase NadA [Methanomicrobiales archaeon]MDI6875656.1 quinolinate synthase NadA [Methanomicrobiales archaeon]